MSYQKAKEIFQDIKNYITNKSDPVAFDLSSGLTELTDTLESDIAEIKSTLQRIQRELKQR